MTLVLLILFFSAVTVAIGIIIVKLESPNRSAKKGGCQ